VALEPWIIEQHEEEERRRREEDEARQTRIEVPLTCPLPTGKDQGTVVDRESPARVVAPRRVEIVPLSPDDDVTFDL
jgi:hypothetical protein